MNFMAQFLAKVFTILNVSILMVQCSIPFSVDEISKSMEQIDISDVEPPALMGENSGFSFLVARPE